MEKSKLLLERHEVNNKQIILGIGLMLLYFSEFFWGNYIPEKIVPIIIVEWYLLLIFLSIEIYFNDLKRDFKVLIKNFREYLPFCFKYWAILIGFNVICTIIIVLLTDSPNSVNQETLNSLPLYFTMPAAIIYAPIVEETIFRGVIRKLVKNNILFIIVSAILFGAIHVTGESSFYMAVVHSLPYVSMGAILAYVYTKTNNITASMTVHATQNTFSMLIQLISRLVA